MHTWNPVKKLLKNALSYCLEFDDTVRMLMEVPPLLLSYVATDNRQMESSSAHVQATWDD